MIRYIQGDMVVNLKSIYSQHLCMSEDVEKIRLSVSTFLTVTRLLKDALLSQHLLVVYNNKNTVHLQSFMSVRLWFPKCA